MINKKNGYRHLRIQGLSLPDPENDPKLHLESVENGLRFSIEIGPFEASAILIELEGLIPPPPPDPRPHRTDFPDPWVQATGHVSLPKS
jgi:hypothetical protein